MLSSWKEIAHFFGKGVRTVQRWEKTLDLPIRRPPGAPSNVVLARTSDLEAWMHRGPGQSALSGPEFGGSSDGELDRVITDLEVHVVDMVVRAGGNEMVPEALRSSVRLTVQPQSEGAGGVPVVRLQRLVHLMEEFEAMQDHLEQPLRKVA